MFALVLFSLICIIQGFDDDEILKKVSDYRKLLLSQLESGELNLDSELDSRDSHARAKAAVQVSSYFPEFADAVFTIYVACLHYHLRCRIVIV